MRYLDQCTNSKKSILNANYPLLISTAKLSCWFAERLHVLNFAHAKPNNTSLPNHHSRRFVG